VYGAWRGNALYQKIQERNMCDELSGDYLHIYEKGTDLRAELASKPEMPQREFVEKVHALRGEKQVVDKKFTEK